MLVEVKVTTASLSIHTTTHQYPTNRESNIASVDFSISLGLFPTRMDSKDVIRRETQTCKTIIRGSANYLVNLIPDV